MARKALERISQREYARRLGISNELVSRAVKCGQIKKGWDKEAAKIIVEHANVEWGAMYLKTDVNKILKQPIGEDDAPEASHGAGEHAFEHAEVETSNTDNLRLHDGTSFAEAKRIREIVEAQLASLELKEKKGDLVRKENVYKELFSFGQQLRVALLAIPDRNIDLILSASNRAEAHQLLTGEIHGVLEEITKTEFNFQPR